MKSRRPKEIRNVLVVTLLCLGFAVLSVILRLDDTIRTLIIGFVSPQAVEYGSAFVFLYLLGLLLLTYGRWQKAYRREKELEAILSGISPDTLIVVDRDRNIQMCNPSIKRMFGYEEAEVLNKKTDVLYSDRRAYPSQYHEIFDVLEKDGFHIGVAAGKRKDGRPLPLEIISGEMKEDRGVVMLLRDISARTQAEDALRDTRQRYAEIVNRALVGMFQCTPDGRITTANTSLARLFGLDTAEEITEAGLALTGPLFASPERAVEFENLLKVRDLLADFEAQLQRRNGKTFWASINARTVRDARGVLTVFEGTIEDITIRKKAEFTLTQSLERLRKATGVIIDVLTRTVEARDPYTSGHQRRVADLARAIGTELGLTREEIDGLRMAGFIHDLGKISIPIEILISPRKLTENEFLLIKTHSQRGYDLIKDIDFPWPIAAMVLQHHERLDGSGYPKGLRGEEIMREARILMVSDVVEAMSSHRPFRAALGIDKALEEIERNRGLLYEPAVVDACVYLFRKKGFNFDLANVAAENNAFFSGRR